MWAAPSTGSVLPPSSFFPPSFLSPFSPFKNRQGSRNRERERERETLTRSTRVRVPPECVRACVRVVAQAARAHTLLARTLAATALAAGGSLSFVLSLSGWLRWPKLIWPSVHFLPPSIAPSPRPPRSEPTAGRPTRPATTTREESANPKVKEDFF